MMKHKNRLYANILFLAIFLVNVLPAENILKILEGYGRDSIATFSTASAHSEAARLFNLILEPNGKITAEKAEDYLSSARSNVIRAYLAVMLADYSFVNDAQDSGVRYLKRAVDEHDPIRNDSYYRSVLDRAQHDIKESKGKEQNKTSVLQDFNPVAIKAEPVVTDIKIPVSETEPEIKTKESPEPPAPEEASANFRIQVGAFSSQDNAQKRKSVFEERGFLVKVDRRERSNGYLYLVRVGAYESYDQAKNALTEMKNKYPAEDGIVIKVEK